MKTALAGGLACALARRSSEWVARCVRNSRSPPQSMRPTRWRVELIFGQKVARYRLDAATGGEVPDIHPAESSKSSSLSILKPCFNSTS